MCANKMRYFARMAFSVLWMPLCLTACAGRPDAGYGTMSISVALRDVHRCSRISPEIDLEGVPPGIDHFDVRLMEYGDGERLLGGGVWKNDDSGVIPEGALARYYRGPCPPPGRSGEYAFEVSAMSKNNIQPVSVRLYKFTQE
ncbi:MAG: MbtF [Desulfovibrio sp.]|nr:MbtF [Desulfovibrio sp.]